jgi:hypothetical protein
LNGSALRLYIYFRSKAIGPLKDVAKYCPLDKEIKAPYSIIKEDTGLSQQSVRNAGIELENKGFIDLVSQGGLKCFYLSSNVYKLSTRFINYGKKEFEPGKLKKGKGVDYNGFGKVHKTEGKYKN